MPRPDYHRTHPREREVFLEAADIEDEFALAGFLDDACRNDAHLRSRVESLLKAKAAPHILSEPAPWIQALTDNDCGRQETVIAGAHGPATACGGMRRWQPPAVEDLNRAFDAYEIESLIGRGGMGAVYKAVQISLQRPVAIKILPPELSDDSAFAERFRREARSMAALDHDNIVTIHFLGTTAPEDIGELFFIVMEYIDGTDLYQAIRSEPLTEEFAISVMSQVCDAVQFAHDRGYIHRDLKPANIFLDDDGLVKVGDFGLAKLRQSGEADQTADANPVDPEQVSTSGLTVAGYLIGTPDYMAPECAKRDRVDHRSDIYSLGVMLYELLTGSIPRKPYDPPSAAVGCHAWLDDIVNRAMHVEPRSRYQQACDLKADITRQARPQRWNRSMVLRAGIATVLAVAAVVGFSKFQASDRADGWLTSPAKESTYPTVTDAEPSPKRNDVLVESIAGAETIRDVVEKASPGQVIRFHPSLSGTRIPLNGNPLKIGTSVTIDASDLDEPLSLDAIRKSRAIEVAPNCTVRLVNFVIRNGRSTYSGGGIRNEGRLSLVDCLFLDNQSKRNGGGITNIEGEVNLEHCIFRRNKAVNGTGGAIHTSGGSVTLRRSLLRYNTATQGGAVRTQDGGEVAVEFCDINSNSAAADGGGFSAANASVKVVNSVIRSNRSGQNGGGLSATRSSAAMVNCSVGENKARADCGQAFFASEHSTMDLLHCTVGLHRGTSLVLTEASHLEIESSIVAGHDEIDDILWQGESTVNGRGVNVVGSTSRGFDSGNQPKISRPPMSSFRQQRSEVRTTGLVAGAPLIDAALTGKRTPRTDQRGFARILDGNGSGFAGPDLGAFEYDPEADGPLRQQRTYVVTSTGDGWAREGTLRQAVAASRKGDIIRFDPDLNGKTIHLKVGVLLLRDRTIDASDLNAGMTIDCQPYTDWAIFNFGSSRVINVTIRGGRRESGTVSNRGELVLERCLITDNNSSRGASAVTNSGSLTLRQCVIARNSSGDSRPIVSNAGGQLRLENCLIAENSGTASIRNHANGTVELTHCTVAANEGVGIISDNSSTLNIEATIVADNGGSFDVRVENAEGLMTTGTNLIQRLEADGISGPEPLSNDPLLTKSGGDGRYSLVSLLPGSPAIDAVEPRTGGLTSDLTGNHRSVDGDVDGRTAPDLGALEFIPNTDE